MKRPNLLHDILQIVFYGNGRNKGGGIIRFFVPFHPPLRERAHLRIDALGVIQFQHEELLLLNDLDAQGFDVVPLDDIAAANMREILDPPFREL